MCAGLALRLDLPVVPDNDDNHRESAPPDVDGDRPSHVELSEAASDLEKAALRRRERELREVHAMPVPVVQVVREARAESGRAELTEEQRKAAESVDTSNVISLESRAKAWEAELNALQGVDLTWDLRKRKELLEPRVAHFKAREKHFALSRQLNALQEELDDLTDQEDRDRRHLLKTKKLQEAAAGEVERLRKERDEKAVLLGGLEETSKKVRAGILSKSKEEAGAVTEEIGKLDDEIGRRQAEADRYHSDWQRTFDRLGELPARIADLKSSIGRLSGELIALGAGVVASAVDMGEPAAAARQEKGEEAPVVHEQLDPSSLRPYAKTRAAIGRTARKVGKAVRPAIKPAIAVGAVGGFGAFGGFHYVGNFFTTWGRRLSNPHRFWDEFIKRLNENFSDSPKGKGFALGMLSTAGWLLFGETQLAPHDRLHHEGR